MSVYLPSFLPVERYARPRLPSDGSLWAAMFSISTSPSSSVLCSATTAICSSRCPMLSLGHRYLVCPVCLCPLLKLDYAQELCVIARPAWSPGTPFPAIFTRNHLALPSFQATLLNSCPALRPRWCPQRSPCRALDCCLPLKSERRLSPPEKKTDGYPDET